MELTMRALGIVVLVLLAMYAYIAIRCPALIVPVACACAFVTGMGYLIAKHDLKHYPHD
jgi:hypothetical protein